MAECKHEIKYLVGMADGIHCKACGAILKTPPAAEAEKPAAGAEKPAPKKKGGKKNAHE